MCNILNNYIQKYCIRHIIKYKYNFEKKKVKCYILLSGSLSSSIFLKYVSFSNESAFLPKETEVL